VPSTQVDVDRVNVREGVPQLIVDDPDRCEFRVNRASMTSGEIWEIEQRRIFDRCWLYVGHATEVAEPNDVRARTIGGRPLLLCRDEDGEVRVFLNSCPHRGTTLCREKATSGRFLRCFFHAWTFDTSGRLVSLPDEDGYGPKFDRAAHGLVSPPRVDSYQGFVFVSFDPDAEDLVDYLGSAREYLDLVVEHGAGEGIEVGRRDLGVEGMARVVRHAVRVHHPATRRRRRRPGA
jgi:p-cumate 2,3-dioxygenase subunit alpha